MICLFYFDFSLEFAYFSFLIFHVSHRKTFKTSARFVFQATLLLSLFLFPFCSNMKLLPSIRSNRHSRQIHTEKARFQFCRFFIPSFLTHITYLPSPPKNQDFIGLGLLFTTIYKTYSLEGERESATAKRSFDFRFLSCPILIERAGTKRNRIKIKTHIHTFWYFPSSIKQNTLNEKLPVNNPNQHSSPNWD